MLRIVFWHLAVAALCSLPAPADAEQAAGYVFADKNGNGQRDPGERGIAGVPVSNGRDVVATGGDGSYRLAVEPGTTLFISKPAGYGVPLDENNLPRFYYLHYPEGTPPELELRFPGLEPTGALPDSVDFPLHRVAPSEQFQVIWFADPQPQTAAEVGYIRDDVVAELVGSDAAFGITVGDIMFDDLALIPRYNQIIAQIGIPWYNVPGNHELNFLSPNDRYSLETFRRYYGPNYYSFDYGDVHFIVLDTVRYLGRDKPHPRGQGTYEGRIDEAQLAWLENDLALVPQEKAVVLAMHIPLVSHRAQDNPRRQVLNRDALLRLVAGRKHALAVAGHTHTTEHHYFDAEAGFRGSQPFHLHVLSTVSGSWWSGPVDDRGIPTTHQRDGTPNGYHVMQVNGNLLTLRYKAAGKPADYQMRITLDRAFHQFSKNGLRDYRMGQLLGDRLDAEQLASASVVVNLFDEGPRSTVEYRIADRAFEPMARVFRADPFVQELFLRNAESKKSWVCAQPSSHVWTAPLPADLQPGAHTITVRAVDEYGERHQGRKLFEVVGAPPRGAY